MTNAAKQIVESLNTLFAPMDAVVLVESQKWATVRQAALQDFENSDEYEQLRRDTFARFAKLFEIAGGKTWYEIFKKSPDVPAFVAKNCAAISAKRNATITAKLIKAGVSQVVSESYSDTADGFDGVFVVMTDKGQKKVTVNTIRAGGYNIQCAHLRVLVKIK